MRTVTTMRILVMMTMIQLIILKITSQVEKMADTTHKL